MVTIVLPTFNERENAVELIRRLHAVFDAKGLPRPEVIVVDDSSPDDTAGAVREAYPGGDVRVIVRESDPGLVKSIREGIGEAGGDLIGWMDADLSMPPELVPDLVRAIEGGADLAAGSRYISGAKDARGDRLAVLLSRIINGLARLLLSGRITDYTTGFVLAKREVLDEIPIEGDYGEYCISFLYRAVRRGYEVRELPYACVPRTRGESKTAAGPLGFLRRGPRYLLTIVRLLLRG